MSDVPFVDHPTAGNALHLESVIPDTPEPLRRAVEVFVAARRAISDRDPKPVWFGLWTNTLDPNVFVDGSIPGDYACSPSETLTAVLPFFDPRAAGERPARGARVPVKSVVGSSWRWHEGTLPPNVRTVEEAIALFTQDACAERGGIGASVCLVRPVGIFYVSGEGKNRVAFLARQGVDLMPCSLTERDYPDANRLRLVAVREGPLCCWLCVLDSSLAVTIPYPEFTLPILEAYGVAHCPWDAAWPMQATVMNSFRRQRSDRDAAMRNSPVQPVIFSRLKDRETRARRMPSSERLPLLGHARLDRQPRYLQRVFIAFNALLLVGLVMRLFDGLDWSATASLGLGGLFGALVVMVVPIGVRAEEVSDAEAALLAADPCDDVEQEIQRGW